LQIVWPEHARRLSVALLPDCDDDDLPLPVTPLSEWLARRPVRLTRYPRPEYRATAARCAETARLDRARVDARAAL
jgi:hypothetical protein